MTTPVPSSAMCPPVSGSPSGYPSSLNRRMLESSAEIWRATAEGTQAYWRGAAERGATPYEVARDLTRWWQLTTQRRKPEWASPHEIVLETPIARLRDFSGGRRDAIVPTLVLPPQAGHDSCIVDYSTEQSQMKVILAAGLTRAYSLDWIGATHETKHTGVGDYLRVIDQAIEHIGGPVNLVGDCQGGWLAAIYAALHPRRINTLTIAGAPIDFHAGNPVIGDYVQLAGMSGDLSFYERLVARGEGVLKGEYMLGAFIGIKPESEVEKQLQLLLQLNRPEHVERYRAFEDWFKYTQDIAGDFYLWIVQHLFRDNELIDGRLEVEGRRVDLGRIRCPLNLLAGGVDHITPPGQVFAMADAVGTPASKVVMRSTSGGHLGLFMGREALRDHWPPIMAEVLAHSTPKAHRETAVRRARAKTPRNRRPIPAP